MDYTFRRLTREECPQVVALIERRIAWMDEAGIDQWNNEDYLTIFPLSYFEERADAGELYGLLADGVLCAAIAALESDPDWTDRPAANALYLHNLVASDAFCGAGSALLERCIALAREQGRACVRLDCAESNERLNQYYIRFGFRYVGSTQAGSYRGNLRQLDLS